MEIDQIEFFDVANLTALAVAEGKIKSFVLAGSAGIGKSYGIEKILKNKNHVMRVLTNWHPRNLLAGICLVST